MPAQQRVVAHASGVSPCGTWNFSVPVFRSIAAMTPYGGFTIGRPSRPCVSAAASAAADRRRRAGAAPGSAPRPRPRARRDPRGAAASRARPVRAAQAVVRARLPSAASAVAGLSGSRPDLTRTLRRRYFAAVDAGVARLRVEDRRFRIEPRARPVDAAAGVADVDRRRASCDRSGRRRRNERRLLPAELLQVLERLRAQRRREVDQVVSC